MSRIIENFILLQMHALMIKPHIKLYYSKKKKKIFFGTTCSLDAIFLGETSRLIECFSRAIVLQSHSQEAVTHK